MADVTLKENTNKKNCVFKAVHNLKCQTIMVMDYSAEVTEEGNDIVAKLPTFSLHCENHWELLTPC